VHYVSDSAGFYSNRQEYDLVMRSICLKDSITNDRERRDNQTFYVNSTKNIGVSHISPCPA